MPGIPNWDELYRSQPVDTLPWFSPALDHDLAAALSELRPRRKAILSLGEGPGTQAIALAKLGYAVTATDISPAAVKQAQQRAARQGIDITFMVDDILRTQLTGTFPLIFDRGCFHVLDLGDRKRYVEAASKLLARGGSLFLKTFSWKEEGPGPHRFRPEEIREIFGKAFTALSVKETFFEGTLDPFPQALFFVLKRQ